MLDFTLKVIAAYLLGSILGSLVIGKLRGGVDIRKLGSGNAGGTNALRTQGPWFAAGVMLIDVGKGWVAAYLVPRLDLGLPTAPANGAAWLAVACAAAAVIGHVYPVWFRFRGGKGAATLIGTVFGLHPIAAIPAMLVWLCVLLMTGYVGLSTMIATASFPVYIALTSSTPALLFYGVFMTAFVVYTHRSNIARMRAGSENRSQRLWLLRPRAR